MRKKQGFTLIELLAVIVILAVIALIATPIIIGIIEDSRVKANENSAYGIIDSAKYYYTQGLLKPENTIKYNENIIDELSYNGQMPKEGSSAFINQNGEVAVALLYGNKCYVKEYSESKLKEGDNKDCKVSLVFATIGGIQIPIVSSGNGLYQISSTEYKYRGGCTLQGNYGSWTCADAESVNNYININNEIYRIIGMDSQGIKIISEKKLTNSVVFDTGTTVMNCNEIVCPRNNVNNTYCQNSQVSSNTYLGCNVYSTISGTFINGSKIGTITQNSSLYNYLNVTGTDSIILNLKNKAISATWNIGAVVSEENKSLTAVKEEEKTSTSLFKIGLMNVSDYIEGSTDMACPTNAVSRKTSSEACRNNNWLFDRTNYLWTINPFGDSSSTTWCITGNTGILGDNNAYGSLGVRPVAYLSSDISVKGGEGTLANPWIIE